MFEDGSPGSRLILRTGTGVAFGLDAWLMISRHSHVAT